MSVALPVQEFQIGQRVRVDGKEPFVITVVYFDETTFYYNADLGTDTWYLSSQLTLAPERPPYVPSERLVVGREVTIARYQPELYRCETDIELAARHTVERAEYDQQDVDAEAAP